MTVDLSPRRSPHVVLASLAFDETAAHVLREAVTMVELRLESELHLVHVVREEGAISDSSELISLERRLEQAPATIRRYVEQLWMRIPRRIIAHLRAGVPSRSILQTAVDIDADIVVVGTHQRSGMHKFILGSTAEDVLQHAHCPVLVAVPKDYAGKDRSDSIQPPCPRCVAAREQSAGVVLWCDQHSHGYAKPHVYEPSDTPRAAVMPTY